jgi:hypothetical protein
VSKKAIVLNNRLETIVQCADVEEDGLKTKGKKPKRTGSTLFLRT